MGLPFSESEAEVVLLSAPWGGDGPMESGPHTAPVNILENSHRLSLYDPDQPEAWKRGIYLRLPEGQVVLQGNRLVEKMAALRLFAQKGSISSKDGYVQALLEEIHKENILLRNGLRQDASALLGQKKQAGLIGGDTSTQLGLLEALAERYNEFGILHLGETMGLQQRPDIPVYSSDTWLTAALKLDSIKRLALAGVRSATPDEEAFTAGREHISVFYHHEIRRRLYRGHTFSQICSDIIRGLPDKVYLSFDIHALQPQYRPNAVPSTSGGFDFEEALYLVKRLVDAELEVIGFGLCGVAGQGNVPDGQAGAILAYRLANLMSASREL